MLTFETKRVPAGAGVRVPAGAGVRVPAGAGVWVLAGAGVRVLAGACGRTHGRASPACGHTGAGRGTHLWTVQMRRTLRLHQEKPLIPYS
jgi:hypothetical protein